MWEYSRAPGQRHLTLCGVRWAFMGPWWLSPCPMSLTLQSGYPTVENQAEAKRALQEMRDLCTSLGQEISRACREKRQEEEADRAKLQDSQMQQGLGATPRTPGPSQSPSRTQSEGGCGADGSWVPADVSFQCCWC